MFPGEGGSGGTALWTRPSLFNNDCSPNAKHYQIGDFMFVETTRTVEAGEVATPLSTYVLNPTPNTLHPTPYTLHPTPYTLHPKP